MKKLWYASLFLLAVVGCQSDPLPVEPTAPTAPKVTIETVGHTSNETITLPQQGTLTLKASVSNTAQYSASWSVDGKEVSTDKEFTFTSSELGEHTVLLTVTNADGGQSAKTELKLVVYGKYKYGTFVLNEGNMTSNNGSLLFIAPDGKITDSAYWRENGSFLGNTTQDLCIAQNKLYIIAQNGNRMGGDGMLVVANAETLKKEAAFNTELATLSWPTHVAVVGDNAYIRDNKGVHRFNLSSRTLTLIAGTKGATKNRMAVVGDKVFVPAGKNIYVIKDGQAQTIDTIVLPGVVSGVVKSYDKNLWVSCTSTPAQILKINPADLSIVKANELGDAKIGAGYGATPGLSAIKDTIYFSNATTRVYRHIFNQGKTEYLGDVKSKIEFPGIVYNNPAVNPRSGILYFNTIKGYGMDYLINEITAFDFTGYTPSVNHAYKNYTQFPAGIFFTYDFE